MAPGIASSSSFDPSSPSTRTRKRYSSSLAADSPHISCLTNISISPPRRCSRRLPVSSDDPKSANGSVKTPEPSPARTPESRKKSSTSKTQTGGKAKRSIISPNTPDVPEKKKRKCHGSKNLKVKAQKRKVYYKRVAFDGSEFEVGDDVYVKRRDESSDDEVAEVEECRVCFKAGKAVMIECDECLGGFHLKCLKPPLKKVPEGDWICQFCEMKKQGKDVQFPSPPKGKKRVRTLREKLLSSDLWAARIDRIWKGIDGIYWFRAHWYTIPEETTEGRQPHNLKRELFLTNDFADVEMETIISHCYVMSPQEFGKAGNEGDDVFFCEYEYDINWHSFKRLSENDDNDEVEKKDDDEDWDSCVELGSSDEEEDMDFEQERVKRGAPMPPSRETAVNSRRGWIYGLQKIGARRIPHQVRCHKQTDIEKAKQALVLSNLPKHLPCRKKEMEEISTFVKGTIRDDLGDRCLYIHGVPGTGKTMSVLSVMRSLKAEVEAGTVKPHCFLEVNGLKLSSAENIYKVIYEALTGHRVNAKKAKTLLTERFVEGKQIGKVENKTCVLLIDELDLLVTRNQGVLFNLLHWLNMPNSRLVIIGIANTMDLPEQLLHRIHSRMGFKKVRFEPYNYQQLQEIIASRLTGINLFESQAVEFAARKVAALTGDARRALEICRRATEIADYNIKTQGSNSHSASASVGMNEVEAAIQEMFQAPQIQVMKTSSKFSKIFLTAMVHELYKTGVAETTFEKVAATISRFCASNGENILGWDTLLRVGCKLGETRIILCEPGAKHAQQKLQLKFPSEDVVFALKDCGDVPWLAKYLSC